MVLFCSNLVVLLKSNEDLAKKTCSCHWFEPPATYFQLRPTRLLTNQVRSDLTRGFLQLVASLLVGNPMSLSQSWVGHKPDPDQPMATPSLRSFFFLTFFMKTFFFLFYFTENYCVLPSLTWVVCPTMNLISRTHYLCEWREYAFMVLREYTIIFFRNIFLSSFSSEDFVCWPSRWDIWYIKISVWKSKDEIYFSFHFFSCIYMYN